MAEPCGDMSDEEAEVGTEEEESDAGEDNDEDAEDDDIPSLVAVDKGGAEVGGGIVDKEEDKTFDDDNMADRPKMCSLEVSSNLRPAMSIELTSY